MTIASRRDVTFVGILMFAGIGAAVAWVALPDQQGFVVLTVLVLVGALAIWRRPPTTDATGRRIRSSTVINAVTVIGIVAIPIGFGLAGLIGGRSAAPIVLGIGVAVVGLLAFALYSIVWVATKRPPLAASIALAIAGVVGLWFAGPAFLDQLAGRNPF